MKVTSLNVCLFFMPCVKRACMRAQNVPAAAIDENTKARRTKLAAWRRQPAMKFLKRVPRLQIKQTLTDRPVDETFFGSEGKENGRRWLPSLETRKLFPRFATSASCKSARVSIAH